MKSKTSINNFGTRLAILRRAKGFTQTTLGDMVGVSRRVIAYYEGQTEYPPTHLLIPLSKALKTSIDELLGLKNSTVSDPNHAALWRRLKKVETLPRRSQQTLFQVLEGLLEKHHSKSK